MSDEPAEWTEAELRDLLAFAANPACIEVAIEAPRLVSLCALALRGLEAERAATEPLLRSVEKILDEHSAWIARPSPEVSRSVAMAAGIRAMASLEERIEFAERETAERVREETLEDAASALDAQVDFWNTITEKYARQRRDSLADDASDNSVVTQRCAEIIRALKKGPSDAR